MSGYAEVYLHTASILAAKKGFLVLGTIRKPFHVKAFVELLNSAKGSIAERVS